MAAGNWVDWNTGDLVTAAAFQDIQDSIVFIYADETAANAALTNKVQGTIFYDTTADVLKAWDGSAWISAETGDITAVNTAANSGLAGGATSGAVSLTVDPSNLSSGVTVDSANDLLILEDVTDGTVYKVTPDDLGIGGGGKILQVVSTLENTQESTTSTSYADLISASITPSSASNKILVIFQDNVWLNRTATSIGGVIQIVADASAISDSEVDMNLIDDQGSTNRSMVWSLNHHYVHSPSTTSAITYKIQWKAYSGTTFYSSFQNQAKHLILMEIEG